MTKFHPIELTPAWKAMTRQAMAEAKADLDRTPVHLLGLGNPNHPSNDGLFGYGREEFLAKQHK